MTYNDISINDKVLTTSNDTGIVIQISSIPFLNHKKKISLMDSFEKMTYKFVFDNIKNPNMFYPVYTVCICGTNDLISCDIDMIKKVIKPEVKEKKTFKQKIRNFFHI